MFTGRDLEILVLGLKSLEDPIEDEELKKVLAKLNRRRWWLYGLYKPDSFP